MTHDEIKVPLVNINGEPHSCADHPSCGMKTYTLPEWCKAYPNMAAERISDLLKENEKLKDDLKHSDKMIEQLSESNELLRGEIKSMQKYKSMQEYYNLTDEAIEALEHDNGE